MFRTMAAKRTFEAELATLEALRDVPPEAAEPELVKALKLRNNLLVSKAAAATLHHRLTNLTPHLVAAFSRFLENPAKSDPQCWAKNAIAKTLAAFEYQEPELFLTGMRHIQLEPVWSGSADTAGTLRGACALALVQCRGLNSHRVLTHLTPLLADKELPVRVNAVRAVEQVGTDSAALLLRLRAVERS
jgi:HEAT repeat protein